MKVITTRSQIREVASKWAEQYRNTRYQDKIDIGRKLALLDGESASPEVVALIIGNDSWTHLKCNECGKSVGLVVELGEPPDYESQTTSVCADCLHKAAALLGDAS